MIPQELNDRLLELAYAGTPDGCVHDWHDFSDDGMTRYFCKKQGCGASHYGPNPPPVGKGYVVTLAEMVRLARKLWPKSGFMLTCDWTEGQDGYEVHLFSTQDQESKPLVYDEERTLADTPEAALAAAIIAAVDGERA